MMMVAGVGGGVRGEEREKGKIEGRGRIGEKNEREGSKVVEKDIMAATTMVVVEARRGEEKDEIQKKKWKKINMRRKKKT